MDWGRLIPGYWVQNYPTDLEWDKALNTLMDEAKEVHLKSSYRTEIDGVVIWTHNYPYAYGHCYGRFVTGLPKVKTRKRLRQFIFEARSKAILESRS
jgi:hypothetical protein